MPPRRPGSFRELARWFQDSVVGPHEQGRTRPRLAPAATMILPSKTLTPEQRVEIYADAYMARLTEALHEDFPAVSKFLGHRAFHGLARAYLERHPSRSWSLNPLGRKLPEFLSGNVRIPKREAVRALATVEVAMAECFDEKAAESLKPGDFGTLPPEEFIGARLTFVPTFRLVDVEYAVNPYIDAVRQEREQSPPLRKKKSWIAIYRKEFKVWRLDLREGAYEALAVLRSGGTVGRAVAAAARVWKGKPETLTAQIRQWFGEWASEGFFSAIRR
ncbi:MAG TPA: DNA-binding domain-containing protein [Planctomycetota bacterium]|nr:DNA-binding domain-containing protein [Planctomycetota bacterium]